MDPAGDIERQLAELENIYRTAPIGLLFVDTELRYVRINDRLAAINGVAAAEHIGRSIWEVLPQIAPLVAPFYQQVIASGEPIIDLHVRGQTKANPGIEHDYLASYFPVKNAVGRVAGVTAVVQDITAQKQAETALRESERRYITLADTLPAIVSAADTAGQVTYWNSRWYAYTGRTPEDSLGHRWMECVHPEDVPSCAARWTESIRGGSSFEMEYRLRGRDGTFRWFLGRAELIERKDATPAQWLGTCTDIEDRKRIEEALRQGERRFALFMQNLPGAAWMKDLDGAYVYANQEAERIFRFPLSVLRGKTDAQLFPPEIATQFRANDRHAIASGGLQTIETLPQEDGIHHSVVSKFPIVGDNGNPLLVGGVAIDITAQRRAEEARRETEQSFRVVAETAADGIVRIDEQSRILFANHALGRIFGYGPAELDGQSLTLLIPDYVRNVQQAGGSRLSEAASAAASYQKLELPGLHRDGRHIPLEISFGEFVSDGQHVFTGILRDVTDRKRAEQRLGAQYAVTRILSEFSNLSDIAPRVLKAVAESLEWHMGGFWTVDNATQSMRCLETWQSSAPSRSAFEGRSRELSFKKGIGLPGRVWASAKAKWIPDLAQDPNFPRAPFAIKEGLHSAFAFPILRNAEVLGVMEFFSPEIREPDTDLLQTMDVIGTQIGQFLERKSLEEQVRQSQKLESLGVLAGGIAHDFNNLLTGILGNVSLGLDTLPRAHPAKDFLKDAISATENAALLTRQMLAYAGKGQFSIELIDLADLVREISSLLQLSIPKSVNLSLNLAPNLVFQGDPAQIRQVVMNLVINAAEAIGSNSGSVLVTASRQEVDDDFLRGCLKQTDLHSGQCVLLEVRDTGCGMDSETLSRIFDPFFTTKFTGRGLGLAAVLGIVHSHKGALKVESTPGLGTTFKVIFAVSRRSATAKTMDPAAGALQGTGMILVVDDEEIVRRTARHALERFGYTVKVADSGADAVTVFRQDPDAISLVLLDLTMPGLSGEETFIELQKIRPSLKVVLTTGYSEMEANRQFGSKGLAGFLQKPYTAARLAERIKSVLASE